MRGSGLVPGLPRRGMHLPRLCTLGGTSMRAGTGMICTPRTSRGRFGCSNGSWRLSGRCPVTSEGS
jgi:hypothetical protein